MIWILHWRHVLCVLMLYLQSSLMRNLQKYNHFVMTILNHMPGWSYSQNSKGWQVKPCTASNKQSKEARKKPSTFSACHCVITNYAAFEFSCEYRHTQPHHSDSTACYCQQSGIICKRMIFLQVVAYQGCMKVWSPGFFCLFFCFPTGLHRDIPTVNNQYWLNCISWVALPCWDFFCNCTR